MNKELFSIIIPSWNNLPYLKCCIDSILKNSDYKHQIIVYINDGTDGTLEWVKENKIDYGYSEENAGICVAMNEGRRLMKTPYLVFFNDDFYACPHWDKIMWDYIKSLKTDRFFIAGTQIQRKGHCYGLTINAEYGHNIEDFDEQRLLKEYDKYECPDDNFACAPPNLIPVSLWDEVGGYSMEFSPGYASDPDLTAKLYFKAKVTHFHQLSGSRVYHFMNKSTSRNTNMNIYRGKVWNQKWKFKRSELKRLIKRISTG